MDRALLTSVLLSLCILRTSNGGILEFLELGTTPGISTVSLDHSDDLTSEAINISVGFPFADFVSFSAFVSDNGFISFGQRWVASGIIPDLFPDSVGDRYIVAPYWYDHDLRIEGDILYEVHELGITESEQLLQEVSSFITSETGYSFNGVWMLVVFWDEVHPFPHGETGISPDYEAFVDSVNSYQAIMITDGLTGRNESYAVFTYKCGLVEWSGIEPVHAVVGYSASGEYYMNYPDSGTADITSLACMNQPGSDWNNVVYNLTVIERVEVSSNPLLVSTSPSSALSTSLSQVTQTVTAAADTTTALQTSPTVTPMKEDEGNGTVNQGGGVPPEVIVPPVVVVVVLCTACAVVCFIVAIFVSKKRDKRQVHPHNDLKSKDLA